MGNIFNQHDDVLYLFEPLHSIEVKHGIENFRMIDNRTFYNRKTEGFLKDIMNCHYHNDSSDMYLKGFKKGGFRYHSRKLISPPFCEKKGKRCFDVTPKLMNEICNDTNMKIVIKELEPRIPNVNISFLHYLSELKQNENDVYIIHLVRDPRAYLLSMKNLEWYKENHTIPELTEDVYIADRCLETLNNLEYFTKYSAEQRRYFSKYAILRYEDFADNPVYTAQRMHDFVKLEFNRTIKEYVFEATSTNNNKTINPYACTARNISVIKNKWRNEENYQFILKVQKLCKKIMEKLGYDMISSKEDLKNINNTFLSKPLMSADVII